jgi:LDH2 family malate/lactate/ureidoglycolate dehydrogenase
VLIAPYTNVKGLTMATVTIPLVSLESWVAAVLERAGLAQDEALPAAKRLLLADITGVRTHGLARLPSYWRQLTSGGLNPRPHLREEWHGNVLVIDADRGLGQIVGPRVLTRAMDALGPARSFVPFLIRNAGHFGALGSHLFEVAEAEMVAFLSQVTQPVMAPEGATRPAIGNNPIAFAAPRPDGPPLVIDFAVSNVARGKIHVAARDGEAIPRGWAIDSAGNPTTSPAAALAGSILPLAGHKGLALAMIVQVLAGVLAGARPLLSEGGAPSGVGAFGFVLDPAPIIGKEIFLQSMGEWTAHYLAAVGQNGRIPGERAAELRGKAKREGMELEGTLAVILIELGRESGAAFPHLR